MLVINYEYTIKLIINSRGKMIFEDNPISTHTEDQFNRGSYVEQLANTINEWDGKNSLVIGLNGKWGSGKTSIINLLNEYLENQTTGVKPTVLFFNPWIFPDIEKLSFHFFNEISKGLGNKSKNRDDKKIVKNLKTYAEIIELIKPDNDKTDSLRLILFFAGIFGILDLLDSSHDGTKVAQLILSSISVLLSLGKKAITFIQNLQNISNENDENKSTYQIKCELDDNLRKRKNKLLIVIDDIDRLSPQSIKHIFHLVRVNADFPNTVFLLAFDFKTVKDVLNEENTDGMNFISKTIQLPFNVPKIPRKEIEKNLLQSLQKLIDEEVSETHENQFDQDYWNSIISYGFLTMFEGMRDIKRYLSSISFHLALIQKGQSLEINLTDYLVIEAFKLMYPDYFIFISQNKELFTKYDYPSYRNDEKQQNKELFLRNIEKIPEEKKKNILSITKVLFPQIGYLLATNSYYIEYQIEWDKNLHICSKKHFDTYFSFSSEGISQYELDSFLSRLDSVSEIKKELTENLNEGRLYELLAKIRLYADDPLIMKDININNLIRALFDVSNNLPDYATIFL